MPTVPVRCERGGTGGRGGPCPMPTAYRPSGSGPVALLFAASCHGKPIRRPITASFKPDSTTPPATSPPLRKPPPLPRAVPASIPPRTARSRRRTAGEPTDLLRLPTAARATWGLRRCLVSSTPSSILLVYITRLG
jgi:hypothetical protein